MIGALWCGVHIRDGVELHMFPVDAKRTVCGRRERGPDMISFIMKGAPSAPGGCVCRACWDAYVAEVLS